MSNDKNAETRQSAQAQSDGRGWRLVKLDILKNPPTALAASLYVIASLFGFAVIVLVGFGLFASFQIAYETAIGKFEARIEAAKVFFPILLALVGGPLLIWRVITAHIQAQATRHQADTGREAHYTTLFTKAVEQLGATREVKTIAGRSKDFIDEPGSEKWLDPITTTEPNLEVRLGAIYALDRVARDSERDHWPIMEVLCAYIRNLQNTGSPKLRSEDAEQDAAKYHKWLTSVEPPRVDVQAALTVIGQRLELRRNLESNKALQLDFRNANLQHAFLNKGHFERANFLGARLDRASFREIYANDASFIAAHLHAVDFYGAHLARASFYSADLSGALFGNADLTDASFFQAQIRHASFYNAHLASASFRQADLTGASFFNSHLNRAEFFGADLSYATDLDMAAFSFAFGDASTKLPEGIERPATWPDRELSWEERNSWIENVRAEQVPSR